MIEEFLRKSLSDVFMDTVTLRNVCYVWPEEKKFFLNQNCIPFKSRSELLVAF